MLELKNVRKIYKTKSGEVNALDGLSLRFPSNGMVFISGKSGCGKTTLLNVIGGLDGIDDGQISLFGKPFSEFSQGEYDDYRNTFIGFIFQEYNLLSEFTVEKNIRLAIELQGGKLDEQELNQILKEMEIENLRNRKPSELSGGQRQRVAIARALVKHPRIIMADEPTGALDSKTGIQVLDILKKLSKDKLIIVVSHDQEFAEKYADRIIRLVDGKVSEDITFTENVFNANVSEKDGSFLIREGSDLSEDDKNAVAKAVKERKKIEIIKELSFREHRKTKEEEIKTEKKDFTLQKSKMKFNSSMILGLKSLGVKPIRLIVTILLSAVAFAVFGLFDTLANFSTQNVMNNLLKNADSTVSVYGQYVIDKNSNDLHDVKLSEERLEEFARETGYTVKGVYDLKLNSSGYIRNSYTIDELLKISSNSNAYYTKNVTGFLEFSPEEISDSGSIGEFGYKLTGGRYPKLAYYSNSTIVTNESLQEVAISTYLADSIIYYTNGTTLNGHSIVSRADLLGKQIHVGGEQYRIVGLVDCGTIPEKYEVLLDSKNVPQSLKVVSENFNTFINSGAHKCLFFPEGRMAYINSKASVPPILYGGNAEWSALISTQTMNKYGNGIMYSLKDTKNENVLMFNDFRQASGKTGLAQDEVLVHPQNLSTIYSNEYNSLTPENKILFSKCVELLSASPSITTLQQKKENLQEIFTLLNKDALNRELTASLTKTSKATRSTITKPIKIVGVYVDVDFERGSPMQYLRFMMSDSLLDQFGVYTQQGEYSRFIFKPSQNMFGTKKIANYMLREQGLTLVWYYNSALDLIRLNEGMVHQGAELFLYVALVLAAFSMFMLFNYITTSIINKRQSIGILRGLGSNSKDMLRMFLVESSVIAIINAVLASILAGVGCILVNWYIFNVMNITIPFALFSIRQVIIIFGMSILTAFLASALPIAKISKEKPVDLIRRP